MAANKLAVTKIADRNIVVPDFPFAHSNPAALISFRATAHFRKRQFRFHDFQIAATGSHARDRSADSCIISYRCSPSADCRFRQTEIFAQRRAGKILAEQTTPLQFRNHKADKIFICARHVGGGEHETVAGPRG